MNSPPKTGQAEVLGLLMIIILLLVAGLIYLRFTLTQQPTLPTLRTNIHAHNLLTALLKLETPTFTTTDAIHHCNQDPPSCPTLKDEVTTILQKTTPQGRDYRLRITTQDTELLTLGTCTQGITATRTFLKDGTPYDTTLTLCEKKPS